MRSLCGVLCVSAVFLRSLCGVLCVSAVLLAQTWYFVVFMGGISDPNEEPFTSSGISIAKLIK